MLSALDHRLFHLINCVWINRVFDLTMPVITDLLKVPCISWGLIPAALSLWLYLDGKRAIRVLIGLVLAVSLSDVVAHRLIKPFFHRARPDPARMELLLRTQRHYGYSFPSNHATNCFTGAIYLGAIYPAWRLPLLAAAAVVAYSRVYVGVHYPFDVLGGAIIGSVLGWLFSLAFKRRAWERLPRIFEKPAESAPR